jgi:hypothetical protein
MRRSVFILVAVLCACEPELPALAIHGVHPPSITAGETRTVEVELNRVPPFLVDYEKGGATVSTVAELRLGPRVMEPQAKYVGHSRFEVTVEQNFPQGEHDVWLKLEDGTELQLLKGFTVHEAIDGLWVETIPNQTQGTPFEIVIHATGDAAPYFAGTVKVDAFRGTNVVKSVQSDSFIEGVGVARMEIDSPGDLLIVVDDGAGSRARSNAFVVNPK